MKDKKTSKQIVDESIEVVDILKKMPAFQNSIPWIEKYRPQQIDDIIMDEYVEKQVEIFLQNRENIHMIITGFPGVGKTSTARCIARKILGNNLEQGYLELNAAEDRGIRSISTIIPPFCKKINNFGESKIILLDEADNMTSKCQYDIKNMMEVFGKKTKFIFTCNESTKIIEDIQSVCRIIRFKNLMPEQICKYLSKICEIENIKCNNKGLNTICYISDGDMRKAINNLQVTAYSYGNITEENVLKICKMPDPKEIKIIIDHCIKGELEKANEHMEEIIAEGYYYMDIVTSFIYVLVHSDMNNDIKLKLIDIANQTKIAVSTGLRSKLQLTAMICRLVKINLR